MVQGSDGQWYAYFANVDLAKIADQIVLEQGVGAEGQSLDFGVFCERKHLKDFSARLARRLKGGL